MTYEMIYFNPHTQKEKKRKVSTKKKKQEKQASTCTHFTSVQLP